MIKRLATITLALLTVATGWVWGPALGARNLASAISGSCPTDPLSAYTPYIDDYSADTSAVNVGVQFKVNGAPYVHGVKFYKGSGNTGTHVAHLYDLTTSTDLASATYSSETSSGWQNVDFSSDVEVTGAHDYMVWVSMPNGNYAVDGVPGGSHSFYVNQVGDNTDVTYIPAGYMGRYAYSGSSSTVPTNTTWNNYWVAPVVGDSTTPTNPSSMSASASGGGQTITWSTAGHDTNGTYSTGNVVRYNVDRYQGENVARVGNFAGDVTSLVDPTAMGSDYSYHISATDGCGNTTSAATVSSASETLPTLSRIFSSNPATLDSGTTSPLTVGMRWHTATAGNLLGVRYYRSNGTVPTSGQFKVGLWDNDGTLLASRAVPTGNDQTGWVDVRFTSPVSVSANHDYVVGYFSPNGKEVYTYGALASGVTNGNLTAVGDTSGTPNGVYSLSSSFSFPGNRSSHSYWYGVDVDFYVP